MNARERFLAVMDFELVPTLKWEFGYWAGALRRWYEEGLSWQAGIPANWNEGRAVQSGSGAWDPGRVRDLDVQRTCGLHEGMQRVYLNNYLCPPFEETVLEEHGDWQLLRDDKGMIVRQPRGRDSLTSFVRGPVACREDWEQLKAERLRPTLEGRLPENWSVLLEGYHDRSYPLALGGSQGFFGTPRYLFGETQVLLSYYDMPDLMHEIVDYLADFWIAIYGQVLDQIDVEVVRIWEDMCYKTGPLVSPAIFREFILPGYRKLIGYLRERGVRHFHVDSDGNVTKLLPLWVEAGVTGLYPFEVMAGMDVVRVREAFPRLQILGGIDKTALARGPAAIDRELETKIPFMLAHGGYIPHVDHHVPPDVSWEDFAYYRRRLNELIDG